jgi:hypothetical protein
MKYSVANNTFNTLNMNKKSEAIIAIRFPLEIETR